MKYFVIYCVALWPVFLGLFVHFHRKRHDVEAVDLAAMIVISLIPFMRELIACSLYLEGRHKVIFRKYK
jgi:hypothetical protein